ncbi:MAG: MarR family winged helix-turn-helix transcriptional regulator [Candidatus Dechloromonas phosphoritropha]
MTNLDLMSRLSLLVFQAQRALNSEGDQLCAPWGLTSAKWKVLGAVDLACQPVSAASIGRAMGLTRQAALKQTDQLLAMGLLTQQVNPNDARAPVYSLSPSGQLAYDGISTEWQKRGASLAKDIAPSALEGACEVLASLLTQMDSVAQPQVSEQASDITQTL